MDVFNFVISFTENITPEEFIQKFLEKRKVGTRRFIASRSLTLASLRELGVSRSVSFSAKNKNKTKNEKETVINPASLLLLILPLPGHLF